MRKSDLVPDHSALGTPPSSLLTDHPEQATGLPQITGCSGSRAVRVSCLTIDVTLIWVSAISFLFFGLGCFASPYIDREFKRYGLPHFRTLVGALQLAGAAGLLAGLHTPWVGQLAAAGLALLMLLGVGVRIKIKDTALQTQPALAYMLLNAYLALAVF